MINLDNRIFLSIYFPNPVLQKRDHPGYLVSVELSREELSGSLIDYLQPKLKNIAIYLELGQERELKSLLAKIVETVASQQPMDMNVTLEIYYSISLMFLSYLNKWNMTEEIAAKMDLLRLTRPEEYTRWNETLHYFMQLIDVIFTNRKSEQEKRSSEVISVVNEYIKNHLDGDISLIRLAEVVHLNPSYLSRLYKQVTGQTISDQINAIRMKKAKELLKNSNIKIYEVAAIIGYQSAPYFTRYFKNEMKMTPQEYRDMC